MVALYGGYATPSRRRLGAVLAHPHRGRLPRLAAEAPAPIPGATLKESTMLMFIIGVSRCSRT
jgi:hypothetical protein